MSRLSRLKTWRASMTVSPTMRWLPGAKRRACPSGPARLRRAVAARRAGTGRRRPDRGRHDRTPTVRSERPRFHRAEGAIQPEHVCTGFVERAKSAHEVRLIGLYAELAPDARSAVKHRPADVVPQPLVVEYKLANRLRKLVTLPLALASPCCLALAFRRAGTCGLDRIGGRAEFVRGDMRNDPGLASSVSGMPCSPAQVSGRRHCMAGRRSSLGHLDLPTHPAASMLDCLTRSCVLRLSRLEPVKDVRRARCRPNSKELMIGVGEGPTAADRHEARVSDLRKDHAWRSYTCIRPTS